MKVEAPFIHLIKLHTKYYLYDVNSKMIVNISNDLFDFFKSNENIKAEIEIPHKLEDEVRRLLKYDLFSKTDTGYEIEYPQGTNLEEILNNCMKATKNNILFDIGWLEYFKSQSYYKCY